MKLPACIIAIFILGAVSSHADSAAAMKKARGEFETADAELNKAYKTLSEKLDKGKRAHLRELQRAWIDYRDTMAEASPAFNDGVHTDNPKATATYWKTRAEMTRDRIDFLRVFTGQGLPPGLNGEYHDDAGATLELEETKKGILFHITAVRGRSGANGELTGLAEWDPTITKFIGGTAAHYKGKAEAGDAEAPCELVFTFVDGYIAKIEEKSPDPGAGNNVHYDREYYKTRKLDGHIKPE